MRRWIAGIAAALVLLLGSAAVWLLATPAGLQFLLGFALDRTELRLDLDAVAGRAIGPLRLDGVRLLGRGFSLEVESLELDHDPLRLLRGEFRVTSAMAREVSYHAIGDPADDRPPPNVVMPIAVRILDARVEGFRFRARDGDPVDFQSIRTAGRLGIDGIHIDRLEGVGADGRVAATGHLGWPTRGRLAIELDWQWQFPGLAGPVVARGPVSGDWSRLEVEQSIVAPFSGDLVGGVDEPLERERRWQATLDFEPVALETVVAGVTPMIISGRAEAEGSGDRMRVDPLVDLDLSLLGSWQAQGRVDIEPRLLRFREVRLEESGGGDGRVAGEGTLRLDPSLDGGFTLALEADTEGLRWPLTAEPVVYAPQAHVRWSGQPREYRIAIDGTIGVRDLPLATLRAEGHGTQEQIRAEQLEGDWLGGRWEGSAEAEWSGPVQWRADLRAEDVDPGSLAPEWPGRLGARLELSGAEGALAHDVHVVAEDIRGELRGYPIDGQLAGALVDDAWWLERADLLVGDGRLQAEGRFEDAAMALEFDIALPDLGVIVPEVGGRLHSSGRIEGDPGAPRILGDFEAEDLTRADIRLASARGRFDIDLAGRAPWELDLEAEALTVAGERRLDRVTATGRGDADDHRLTLAADGEAFEEALLEAAGSWDGERWRGELLGGRFGQAMIGSWVQTGAAPASVSAADARVGPWCWVAGEARACFEVASTDWQRWDIDARLDAFNLAPLTDRMEEVDLEGRIGGHLRIAWNDGLGAIDGRLSSDGGRLHYRRADGRPDHLRFEGIEVEIRRDTDLVAILAADLGPTGRADGRLVLAGWTPERAPEQQPLDGQVDISLVDLDFLPALFPDVVEPSGRLEAALRLSGRAAAPRVEGEARLADGTAVLPRLGIELRDIRMRLLPGDGETFRVEASARSGTGQVNIEGTLQAVGGAEWGGDIAVLGQRFEVMRLPGTHVIVSPDMNIRVRPRSAHATGRVIVDETDIVFGTAPRVVTSPDVVIVGVEAEEDELADLPWQITTDLRIEMGPSVRVAGAGFVGRLAGAIVLREDAATGGRADGEIRVAEGRFAAYGQTLDIHEGRIVFVDDPLDNPRLDLDAQRMVGDTLVGVRVGGRAQAPTLRLFANPPMEEREVLAMLAFGRPLVQLSREEGEDLARTAAETGGGNGVAARVANYFGIQQIELDPTPGQQAVVVGSQLSSRLYVGYAVGLLDTANALRVRYRLTDRWALQTDIGAQGGGDLIYSIER